MLPSLPSSVAIIFRARPTLSLQFVCPPVRQGLEYGRRAVGVGPTRVRQNHALCNLNISYFSHWWNMKQAFKYDYLGRFKSEIEIFIS